MFRSAIQFALLLSVQLTLVGGAAAKPAAPERLSAAGRDSLARLIEEGRANDDESLRTGATSYLATVTRVDYLR